MAKKIKDKGSGTLEWRAPHWYVRVFLSETERPRYRLCAHRPECNCATLSEAYREDMRKAISERERARHKAEADRATAAASKKRLTVKELGEEWTKGKLLEAHGEMNHLTDKRSAKDDGYRLGWAYRVTVDGRSFGDIPVSDVTEAHCKRVMAMAPKLAKEKRDIEWRPASKLHLYQVLHRLFELAAVPCELRPRGSNPMVKELRPKVRHDDKVFQWLYPDEVAALLRTKKVPLARRVLYALAIWTGQRKESLFSLKWRHLDAAHGTITSPHQKNRLPLTFDVSADLLELLEGWRQVSKKTKPDDAIVGKVGARRSRLAETLRADLKEAGVDRPALQGEEAHEEAIRFHDCRATMVVWGLKDPAKGYGWVTDRTGHLTPRMLQRYDRAARTWREAKIIPFPPLVWHEPEHPDIRKCSIPELSQELSHAHLRAVG